MACINCFKPIEPEKLEILPEARYCIKCAKALHGDNGHRKPGVVYYCPPIRNQVISANSGSVSRVWVDTPSKKKAKSKTPVLMERVFDSGKSTQSVVEKSKAKLKNGHAILYEDDSLAMVGDVVFTESLAINDDDRKLVWIVDCVKTESGTVLCHSENDTTKLITLFSRQAKLLYRKDDI